MRFIFLPVVAFVMFGAAWAAQGCTQGARPVVQLEAPKPDAAALVCNLPQRDPVLQHATKLIDEGRRTFRYETFVTDARTGA